MTDYGKKGKKKPTEKAVKDEDSILLEVPSISTLMGRKKAKFSSISESTRTAIERGSVRPAPSKQAQNTPQIELEDSDDKTLGTGAQMGRLEPLQTVHTQHSETDSKLGTGAHPPILGAESGSVSIGQAKAKELSKSVTIKRLQKKKPSDEPDLIEWSHETLKKTPDPLAKALELLIREGAKEALFLVQVPSISGATPQFLYSAAYRPENKRAIWKGLRWDPRIAPDFWSLLIRKGYFELEPPGPSTLATSARNVTRGAFGAENDQWLSVLRVGPKDACRGLLAVFSTTSLEKVIPVALKLMEKDPLSPIKNTG